MRVVRRLVRVLTACALVLVGCGGNVDRTPGDGGSAPPKADGANDGVPNAGDGPATTVPNDDLSGTWLGYVENYEFSDQSDAVKLVIARGPNDTVSGHVTFGKAAPPEPLTDPEAGFPTFFEPFTRPPLSVGFPFTMAGASITAQRLKFGVASSERWSSWCAMQTPVADTTNVGNYGCLPNWGFTGSGTACSQTNPMTMEVVQVSCVVASLCLGFTCNCTATACATSPDPSLRFDMTVTASKIDGSVTGLGAGANNVHLTKQ